MVNQAIAVTNSKLGKYIPTIDLEFLFVTKQTLESKGESTQIGKFWIDGKFQLITLKEMNDAIQSKTIDKLRLPADINKNELEYIFDTFDRGRTVFFKKIRLGVF